LQQRGYSEINYKVSQIPKSTQLWLVCCWDGWWAHLVV